LEILYFLFFAYSICDLIDVAKNYVNDSMNRHITQSVQRASLYSHIRSYCPQRIQGCAGEIGPGDIFAIIAYFTMLQGRINIFLSSLTNFQTALVKTER